MATDFNPGTSPFASLHLAMNMACVKFGLTPEEAWAGVTRHAARALGPASHGQLAPGFVANFAIWDAEHPVEMVYEPGAVRSGIALFKESCNDAVAATPASLWQGRDDSAEAPNALRLFQTIVRAERFAPQEMPGDIALLGFACDEGVRRNKAYRGSGRPGDPAPGVNMASHQGHDRCVDMGTISVDGEQLEAAHQALREAVADCQRAGKRTLVPAAATRRPSATALGYWMPSGRKSGHY